MSDLHTRIAGIVKAHRPVYSSCDICVGVTTIDCCECGGWLGGSVVSWDEHVADAVIRELDGVLVDWGLWLSEEIAGRQMTRLDMESCLTDWKADDE